MHVRLLLLWKTRKIRRLINIIKNRLASLMLRWALRHTAIPLYYHNQREGKRPEPPIAFCKGDIFTIDLQDGTIEFGIWRDGFYIQVRKAQEVTT